MKHIYHIWDDVDSWWSSKKTQNLIKKFNFNFNLPDNSINDLARIFKKLRKTSQENFWEREFGNNYTLRNLKSIKRINVIGNDLRKNNLKINSAFEIGCNIGLNLQAIRKLYPKANISGVEINHKAYKICKKKILIVIINLFTNLRLNRNLKL